MSNMKRRLIWVEAPRLSRWALAGFATLVASNAWAVPISGFTKAVLGMQTQSQMHDVADAGDLDLDGFTDLVLGDPNAPIGAAAGGGVAWISRGGPGAGLLPNYATILGVLPGDQLGAAVDGVGDFNCDGAMDLAVGAPGFDGSGVDSGAVFVFYGPLAPGAHPALTANLVLFGEAAGDNFGKSVQLLRDVDFDGCSDLIVGAPMHAVPGVGIAGSAYVVPSLVFAPGGVAIAAPGPMLRIDSPVPAANFGWAVDTAGDFDGDGMIDVIIGAPTHAPTGAAYVFYRPGPTWLGGITPAPAPPFSTVWFGEPGGAAAGWSVDGGRDLNGDGRTEVLIGAPRAMGMAGFGEGAVYLASASLVPIGPGVAHAMPGGGVKYGGVIPGGSLGWDVSFANDVNLDGRQDWMAGAPMAPVGGGQGRVYFKAGTGVIPAAGTILPIAPPATPIDSIAATRIVGYSLDGSFDNDLDGRPDPLIGAYHVPSLRNFLTSW